MGVAMASGGSSAGRGLHATVTVLPNLKLGREGRGPGPEGQGPTSKLPASPFLHEFGFPIRQPSSSLGKGRERETNDLCPALAVPGPSLHDGVRGDGPGVRGVPALCHLPWNAVSRSVLGTVGPYCETGRRAVDPALDAPFYRLGN